MPAFKDLRAVATRVSSGASVFARIHTGTRDDLPVLMLLHGYPQNGLMWNKFTEEIPEHWPIVVPDLPGYGNSAKQANPAGDARGHSKRAFAQDILELVDAHFGTEKKVVAYGHDRGARVAYRMALDRPERVAGIAVLDIVPGIHVWNAMNLANNNHRETRGSHHWIFLASPRPLPETLIGNDPAFYFNFTARSWAKNLAPDADTSWINDAVHPYLEGDGRGAARIEAACEDYRAGATIDIDHDREQGIDPLSSDPPKPIFTQPILILSPMYLRRHFDVDGIWSALGQPGRVESYQIGGEKTGHFLVNEAQVEVGERTRAWLAQWETSK